MNGFIEKVLVLIVDFFILLMIVIVPSVDQYFTDNPSDQCETVLVRFHFLEVNFFSAALFGVTSDSMHVPHGRRSNSD